MKVFIVGCGKVGEKLCIDLAQEGHDVILIEANERILNQLIAKADITGFCGNGALHEVQLEAGIQDCDVFIAVTPRDETNIIAAITAKINGVSHTIARVRDPDYTQQMNFLRAKLGIQRLINPELQAARDIAQMLQFPEAVHVDQFANGRVYLIQLRVPKEAAVIGQSMKSLRSRFPDLIFCIIERQHENPLIPHGETTLEPGDSIYVTGTVQQIDAFYNYLGLKQRRIRNAMIIGAGRIARYLIPRLQRAHIEVKIIEKNEAVAQSFAEVHKSIEVICGDGTDQQFLLEEQIESYDAVISLTGIDEENMLVGLFAESIHVPKVISKINRLHLLHLIQDHTGQSVVTPKQLVADQIVHTVRALANSAGSNVDALYRLSDERVEALQFVISKTSKAIHQPLAKLQIKPNILIAYILRGNQIIFPAGTDWFEPGDRVIVITTHKNFDDLDDILEERSLA